MGTAADLFHSADASRQTLHRRITPTNDQQEDQKERWNHLADFLKSRLKDDTGLSTRTWLQGSYKFGTQIRPWNTKAQFDIDLGLYFEWKGSPKDGDSEPEDLKGLVQKALLEYQRDDENDATDVEDPKERCCRISFNPDFHIDVPCYHLDNENDARALATETRGWEDSDPKAIYVWFKDEQDDQLLRAKVRRQVRYLKMWAALNFSDDSRPSSILLTVLTTEAVRNTDLVALAEDDLLELIINRLQTQLSGSSTVSNPVEVGEDLNRLSDEAHEVFIEQLATFSGIALRANAAAEKSTAAEIWAEAFGHFFPMPEDNDEEVAQIIEDRALAVYRAFPQIAVKAVPRGNAHKTLTGTNSIALVPKDCDISFTLMNAGDFPAGATWRWTVRNSGEEAAFRNDLGHHVGSDVTATRHTEYNGKHAMDLTVYLGSQIIGRRRVEVRVSGMQMPARHKKRRRPF